MPQSTFRVLLADDGLVNRQLALRLLEREGYAVTAVANGSDAVSQLKQGEGQFGVVLMDIEMPVMDGLTATRAIRAWEKDRPRRTPIVALTSLTDQAACFDAGVDAFLNKPLQVPALRKVLHALNVRIAA
jgi:CheY-like chemotaxis protein